MSEKEEYIKNRGGNLFVEISSDNDTSIVYAGSSKRRGGGEIHMLSAKAPTNVIKLKTKKGVFRWTQKN